MPVFGPGSWERLRALNGELPVGHELPRINSRETARLSQWSAPGRVLGKHPEEPRLNRDLLIAVTNGDLTTEAALVDDCLQRHHGAVHPMEPVPTRVNVIPIEFWLDLPGTPGWKSFAHIEGDVCFLLDDGIALRRDGGLTTSGT